MSEVYLTTSEIRSGCWSQAVINQGGLLCPDKCKDSLPVCPRFPKGTAWALELSSSAFMSVKLMTIKQGTSSTRKRLQSLAATEDFRGEKCRGSEVDGEQAGEISYLAVPFGFPDPVPR